MEMSPEDNTQHFYWRFQTTPPPSSQHHCIRPTLALHSPHSGTPIIDQQTDCRKFNSLQFQPQPRNWQLKHVSSLRGPASAGSCKDLLPWVFTRKSCSGNVLTIPPLESCGLESLLLPPLLDRLARRCLDTTIISWSTRFCRCKITFMYLSHLFRPHLFLPQPLHCVHYWCNQ